MIPSIGSKWRHVRTGVVYEVYDVTNEHAEQERRAEYPVMVSYRAVDKPTSRWSITLDAFSAKMRSHVALHTAGTVSSVEEHMLRLLIPKYHVTFDRNFVPKNQGLYYFIDAEHTPDAEQEARRCLDFVLSGHAALAGPATSAAFAHSTLKFNKSTIDERNSLFFRGLNYVGIIEHDPVVWGLRTSTKGSVRTLRAVASAIAHAAQHVVSEWDRLPGSRPRMEAIYAVFSETIKSCIVSGIAADRALQFTSAYEDGGEVRFWMYRHTFVPTAKAGYASFSLILTDKNVEVSLEDEAMILCSLFDFDKFSTVK